MEVRAGYKNSIIGVIPEDWDLMPFKKATYVITCGVAATPKYVSESLGKPFLSASHVQNGKVITDDFKFIPIELYNQITKNNKPEKGDILYTRVGAGIGEAGVIEVDFDFAIYVSLTLIKPKKFLDSYFLKSLLNSNYYRFLANRDQFAGGGVQNLNVQVVREFPIPIPTKAEQTAIATALSDADDLITSLEKLIAKKRNIKQGAMQKLLQPKGGWEVKKLGDFLDYEQPTEYLVTDTEYNNNNQTPVLTAGKTFILGYTNEEHGIFKKLPVIIFDDFTTAIKYVDFSFKAKSSAMKMLLPINSNVNLRFIYEMMLQIKYQVADHKRHWISEFRNIEIIVPPTLDEQNVIAVILSDMDAEINALETKLKKYKMLKLGMMQNLLTGKIRLI